MIKKKKRIYFIFFLHIIIDNNINIFGIIMGCFSSRESELK